MSRLVFAALALGLAVVSLASAAESPARLQVKGDLDSAGFLSLLASAPGYDAKKSVLKVCRGGALEVCFQLVVF